MLSTLSPSRMPESWTPSSSASLRPSEISSKVVGIILPCRCSQKTHTPEKALGSVFIKVDISFLPSQMMCLADRMPNSRSTVSLPLPSSIMPLPLRGGVKLL